MRATFFFVATLIACGGGGGSNPDGGTTGPDGSSPRVDGGGQQDAALPPPPTSVCTVPATAVDTSKPTTVVSDCSSDAALRAAVATGGIVTFSCGTATIPISSEIPVAKDTTIDGAGTITLDGGGKNRILHITSAWNVTTPLLTVQNLAFENGFTSDVANTTSTKEGGGAIFEDGGALTVINCTFSHNTCASSGQDVSGGAINGQGSSTLIIVGSTFSDNSGSNGGGVGTQDENVTVVNSTFANNSATGTDGNPGNGGNGGGLTYDGAHVSLTLCGDTFTGNKSNAAGGAVFRVGYNDQGGAPSVVTIDRSTFDSNTTDANVGNAAGLYLENVELAITNTTISNNTGHYGGGLWAGQSDVLDLQNVTIANNTASGGGGIWFANGVTGTLLNCTVAGNTGDGLFGGDTGVALKDTIIANNVRGTLDSTTNCAETHASGEPDIQYPQAGGKPCTSDATIADPKLGTLADNGGPVKTMKPASGSPAIAAGKSCSPTDAAGTTRPSACTLGAIESQ
jgi:hypothetical protein